MASARGVQEDHGYLVVVGFAPGRGHRQRGQQIRVLRRKHQDLRTGGIQLAFPVVTGQGDVLVLLPLFDREHLEAGIDPGGPFGHGELEVTGETDLAP